jgi:hypothetical protein
MKYPTSSPPAGDVVPGLAYWWNPKFVGSLVLRPVASTVCPWPRPCQAHLLAMFGDTGNKGTFKIVDKSSHGRVFWMRYGSVLWFCFFELEAMYTSPTSLLFIMSVALPSSSTRWDEEGYEIICWTLLCQVHGLTAGRISRTCVRSGKKYWMHILASIIYLIYLSDPGITSNLFGC